MRTRDVIFTDTSRDQTSEDVDIELNTVLTELSIKLSLLSEEALQTAAQKSFSVKQTSLLMKIHLHRAADPLHRVSLD